MQICRVVRDQAIDNPRVALVTANTAGVGGRDVSGDRTAGNNDRVGLPGVNPPTTPVPGIVVRNRTSLNG